MLAAELLEHMACGDGKVGAGRNGDYEGVRNGNLLGDMVAAALFQLRRDLLFRHDGGGEVDLRQRVKRAEVAARLPDLRHDARVGQQLVADHAAALGGQRQDQRLVAQKIGLQIRLGAIFLIINVALEAAVAARNDNHFVAADLEVFQSLVQHRQMQNANVDLVRQKLFLDLVACRLDQGDDDVWVLLLKIRKNVGQYIGRLRSGEAQADFAVFGVFNVLKLPVEHAALLEYGLGKFEKAFALARELDAAAAACEQRDPQLSLQLVDALTQRRLGDEQSGGSAGDAFFCSDLNKIMQILERHGLNPPRLGLGLIIPQYFKNAIANIDRHKHFICLTSVFPVCRSGRDFI